MLNQWLPTFLHARTTFPTTNKLRAIILHALLQCHKPLFVNNRWYIIITAVNRLIIRRGPFVRGLQVENQRVRWIVHTELWPFQSIGQVSSHNKMDRPLCEVYTVTTARSDSQPPLDLWDRMNLAMFQDSATRENTQHTHSHLNGEAAISRHTQASRPLRSSLPSCRKSWLCARLESKMYSKMGNICPTRRRAQNRTSLHGAAL